MAQPWVVLKFGGTSVAGRPQWETIARLAALRRDEGFRVLVVCSAVAGITDLLERLAEAKEEEAAARLEEITHSHRELASELDVDANDLLAESAVRLVEGAARARSTRLPSAIAALLAEGEWLSTRIGARFLERQLHDRGMPVEWIDVREALHAQPEPDPEGRRAWLGARCIAGHDRELQAAWGERAPVLITQGFVAAAPDGGTALLGRGGSDTSAALLGGRLGAARVEIWTDVAGLYTADPRMEPAARLLPRLDYAEALEMAAGGAKVVHGRAIRAAAETGTPLWIRKLGEPDAPGTDIGGAYEGDDEASPEGGVRAVVHQPGMLGLLLENLDTRQQVGFLAGVFRAISDRGVSVDLVATSETTTTLAINRVANVLNNAAVEELEAALTPLCRVVRYDHCACVNLVGRGARRTLANLAPARDFLREHPLLMVSQSANDLGISLLLHAGDAPELARLLHRCLVEERPS